MPAAAKRPEDDVPQRLRAYLTRYASRFASPVAIGIVVGFLLRDTWVDGAWSIIGRSVCVAIVSTAAFSLAEYRPRKLPRWLSRWVLQVICVAVAVPLTTTFLWVASTGAADLPFWEERPRMLGFMMLTFLGLLTAPWVALSAVVRDREAAAREQRLAFSLERSELQRTALDARLHILRAQVAPHFLFNTLANIQALVESGSPRAPGVLRSLTTYLRAAVPLLDESGVTVGDEVRMVRAYLELMHMRMPDRLEYTLEVDDSMTSTKCPPATILTLVENAIRHGIDPSEEGGSIHIRVKRQPGNRCSIVVTDTGVGLRQPGPTSGTGLETLRERLLLFDAGAAVTLTPLFPRGAYAHVELAAS